MFLLGKNCSAWINGFYLVTILVILKNYRGIIFPWHNIWSETSLAEYINHWHIHKENIWQIAGVCWQWYKYFRLYSNAWHTRGSNTAAGIYMLEKKQSGAGHTYWELIAFVMIESGAVIVISTLRVIGLMTACRHEIFLCLFLMQHKSEE